VAIVLKNIGTLATCGAAGPQDEIHTIPSAALVWEGGEILWIGPERDLPGAFADAECWDAGGRLVIPGLVDCHTHLAFGGDRADEFEQRCLGTSYQAIAQAGGGIAATVGATRGTSEADLQDRAAGYLREMVRLGVTTVEAKSGYGLNLETERKLLTVYRHLGQRQPVRIVSTFLGAHVVAPEYRDDRTGYVDLVVDKMIPSVAAQGLAKFCERRVGGPSGVHHRDWYRSHQGGGYCGGKPPSGNVVSQADRDARTTADERRGFRRRSYGLQSRLGAESPSSVGDDDRLCLTGNVAGGSAQRRHHHSRSGGGGGGPRWVPGAGEGGRLCVDRRRRR